MFERKLQAMMLAKIARSNRTDWLIQVAYTTWKLFAKNSLQNHAAATAFYFMLAATPLLLLLSYAMQWLGKLAESYVPATMLFAALYDQLQLQTLTEIGFLPKQTQLSASGIGLLTLLLSSRGLLNAVQSAFKIIFPADTRRKFVHSWLLPLTIIPVAFALMGLAGMIQSVLSFFASVQMLGPWQVVLLKAINYLFLTFTIWLLVFLAYWRIPLSRPPVRMAAAVALLTALTLLVVFALFGYFFKLEKYQSLYGALGGAVFVLIATYFACAVFYLWAQCLYTINQIDVEALEKLFLAGTGESAGTFENLVFGRANRLLERYGKTYQPGEILIRENDTGQEAFYLYSGTAAAYKELENGEHRLGGLNEGHLFGEMAYLLKEKRTATVRAESKVVALVLPPEMLEQLMRHSAPLSRRIIGTLCQRLEKMNQAVNDSRA